MSDQPPMLPPWAPPAPTAAPPLPPDPGTSGFTSATYGSGGSVNPTYPTGPHPAHAAPRRGLGAFAVVLVSAVTALIVGAVSGLAGYVLGRSVDASRVAVASAVPVTASVEEPAPVVAPAPIPGNSIASIVSTALPSVVSIVIEGASQSGSGSGFVLRDDGYIVTNHHVVELAESGGSITVVFNDGTKQPGTVVGSNSEYDLAVVKVPTEGLADVLKPMPIGDSGAVNVGDPVIAIGAPLGLDGTVTSGIISAVDRPVTAGVQGSESYINAIQTDAAINPGNSGGPLLNAAGQVIGVNSAIATLALGEGGSIGLGFAIPVNSVRRIADEIITTGSSSTPIIGVTLDLSFTDSGARLRDVNPGGPSELAGLLTGDIIVRVNDRIIDDATELVVAIRSFAPGDTISLGYLRNGQEGSVNVTLGSSATTN
ncbi:MAG: trypsin-like peptidase domain-containing protein [Actinomycetales bacterium]|nr:trypsin-like peptidase domain-containing protein [Actinomycetales bacterium]